MDAVVGDDARAGGGDGRRSHGKRGGARTPRLRARGPRNHDVALVARDRGRAVADAGPWASRAAPGVRLGLRRDLRGLARDWPWRRRGAPDGAPVSVR